MDIAKLLISAAGLAVLYLAVRSINERFAVLVSLAVGILILFAIIVALKPIFVFVQELASGTGIDNRYFKTVIKCLAMCYLCEFSAGICRDIGQGGWGEKLELACRCSLLVLAIPLFEEFLDVVVNLLE